MVLVLIESREVIPVLVFVTIVGASMIWCIAIDILVKIPAFWMVCCWGGNPVIDVAGAASMLSIRITIYMHIFSNISIKRCR